VSRIDIADTASTAGAAAVRVITFNRPEVRNAFDSATYHDVTQALRDADQDESVGAVVLTGRGSAFSSGQDLAEMAAVATGTARASGRIRRPGPRRSASPPRPPVGVLFPARMGWQQAARLLLTSDWVTDGEAVDLGMALRVCPDGTSVTETVALAARIAAHPHAVEGVRAEDYQRTLCPLVSLSTAVSSTERLRLGTGILPVAQHDPIVLAKQIATLDHLSHGRVVLAIGFGWNRAEGEDHGVDFAKRHALVREHLLCMQALWTQEQAQFHGEFIDLPLAWAWPKPNRQPGPRVLVGGGAGAALLSAVADYADGWIPFGGSGLGKAIPRLHRLAEEKERDPATLDVIPFGTVASEQKLEHYSSLGVTEVILRVQAGNAGEMLSQLDALAPLVDTARTLA
jgi:probable F420-dependent oxidoreductase